MQVRWLIRRDMPEVLDIERLCFSDPWSEKEFLDALRVRTCIGMVAEDQDHIVGYMIYELTKDSLILMNFAVNPVSWRIGIGRTMVDRLVAKLRQGQRTKIDLTVREANLPAQLFFRSQGFQCVGTTRELYSLEDGSREDAYHFRFQLTDIHQPFFPHNRITEYIENQAE